MIGRALAGLLVAGCAIASPAMPTEAPVPSQATAAASLPPGDIGLGRGADPRDFSVTFVAWSEHGEEVARKLASALPDAWDKATRGRSRVRVIGGDADIHVVVLLTPGVSTGGGRAITLRFGGTIVGPAQIAVLLHELGHAHGCCHGEAADGTGHWAQPCDGRNDLMCASGPRGSMTFSDRELRVLRLD